MKPHEVDAIAPRQAQASSDPAVPTTAPAPTPVPQALTEEYIIKRVGELIRSVMGRPVHLYFKDGSLWGGTSSRSGGIDLAWGQNLEEVWANLVRHVASQPETFFGRVEVAAMFYDAEADRRRS